jgi:glutaredoxin
VDIDSDEIGEELVLSTNHGMRSVPTIVFEDGSILVEPTDTELQHKLKEVLKTS